VGVSTSSNIMTEDPYTLIKRLDKKHREELRFYLSVGEEDKRPYLMLHQCVDVIGRMDRFNYHFKARIYAGEDHRWGYVAKDLRYFIKYSWNYIK